MDYIDDMSLALPNQQQVGESNIDFKRLLQKTSVCQRGEYIKSLLKINGKIE
jgi:hypothetical protein